MVDMTNNWLQRPDGSFNWRVTTRPVWRGRRHPYDVQAACRMQNAVECPVETCGAPKMETCFRGIKGGYLYSGHERRWKAFEALMEKRLAERSL